MKLYTVKVMANCLDLSERRVRQLREEGILIEAAPGLYELWPNVRRYINFLRGNADGKADLNEERAKLTREKRIAAEQENKVKSGELYRKQDIMLGLSTMLMNLRSRIPLESTGDQRQVRCGQSGRSDKRIPPQHPCLYVCRMGRSGAEVLGSKRSSRPRKPGGNESLGKH